eukprot:GEMP01026532.1.p1 GENE.GEMP01026532.1~~GEMP01026532.1.p1  ORF type:complete len:115 (+),score=10.32 GEMP01026532.1:1522-1866(+)
MDTLREEKKKEEELALTNNAQFTSGFFLNSIFIIVGQVERPGKVDYFSFFGWRRSNEICLINSTLPCISLGNHLKSACDTSGLHAIKGRRDSVVLYLEQETAFLPAVIVVFFFE